MKVIVDAEGGEDEKIVLRLVVADEGGVGFEDGLSREDEGAGDGEVGGSARRGSDDESEDDA